MRMQLVTGRMAIASSLGLGVVLSLLVAGPMQIGLTGQESTDARSIEVSCVMVASAIARITRFAPRATQTNVRGWGSRWSQTWQTMRS